MGNKVWKTQNKPKRIDAGKKRGPREKKVDQEDSRAQVANGKCHAESNEVNIFIVNTLHEFIEL